MRYGLLAAGLAAALATSAPALAADPTGVVIASGPVVVTNPDGGKVTILRLKFLSDSRIHSLHVSNLADPIPIPKLPGNPLVTGAPGQIPGWAATGGLTINGADNTASLFMDWDYTLPANNADVSDTAFTITFAGDQVGVTPGAFNVSVDYIDVFDGNKKKFIHPQVFTASGRPLDFKLCAVGVDQNCQSLVPEPSSWVLMIAGLGVVGLGLRRRRAGLSTARAG
jgi:hypothetical protein